MALFRQGLPFAGFNATIAKHLIPRNMVSADSRDWSFDPTEGKFVRRAGSNILGDTVSGGNEVTGILTSKHSTKPRQIIELAHVAAVNSIVSELRAVGNVIDCKCVGRGRFVYRLVEPRGQLSLLGAA